MSATDTAAATHTCTTCNAVNTAAARFCPSCGTPLASGAPAAPSAGPVGAPVGVPVPPRPPLAPQLNGAISGMMNSALGAGVGGAESMVQAAFPMDANTAFTAVSYAVSTNNGQVKFTQPPTSMTFETTKRAIGLTIRYDGLVQVASMNAQQSAVRVQLQPVKGTLTPVFFVGAIASLFMMFTWYITLNLGLLGLLFGIVATAAQYHSLATATPRGMAEKILASMSTSASSPASKVKPTPVPAASPSVVPVVGPTAAESTIFDQLTQLGRLRDAGILTAQEFDQKKAELLSRL